MRGRPIVVAVEGASGAGKSTVVARAADRFGWVPLAEAYDRLDPRPRLDVRSDAALARLERTLLDEEARRFDVARALCAGGSTVIADTGFLGPLTYSAGLVALGGLRPARLADLLRRADRLRRDGRWGMADLVVVLSTSPRVRAARQRRDPIRHPPALAARHESVGRIEEAFYRARLGAERPGYVRSIAAGGSISRVIAAVGRAVGAARRSSDAPAATRAALRLLRAVAAPGGRPFVAPATVKKSPLPPVAPSR